MSDESFRISFFNFTTYLSGNSFLVEIKENYKIQHTLSVLSRKIKYIYISNLNSIILCPVLLKRVH